MKSKICQMVSVFVKFGIPVVISLVLLLAAFSKFSDLSGFRQAIADSRIFDDLAAGVILMFLPGFELVLGFCLLFRLFLKETIFLASSLLFLFLMFSIVKLSGGLGGKCGCFNLPSLRFLEFFGWGEIIRNASLFALCLTAIFFHQPEKLPLRCSATIVEHE